MKKDLVLFLCLIADCMNRFTTAFPMQTKPEDCFERIYDLESLCTTYYHDLFWTIDQVMLHYEDKSWHCIYSRLPRRCSYIARISAMYSIQGLIRRYYHDEKRKHWGAFFIECNRNQPEAPSSTSQSPYPQHGNLESAEVSSGKPFHGEKVPTQPEYREILDIPIPSRENKKKQIPPALKDSGPTIPVNFVVLIVFGAAIPIAVVVGVFWLLKFKR